MQWNDSYTEQTYSFANNINTIEGGTHLSGFRAALTRSINNYATQNNLTEKLSESVSGDDIREGMIAIISVKIPQPQFEGQTKEVLGTNAAIKRGGELGKGGATMVKVSKPDQDMRFDVPVIGPDTITAAADAGVDVIAIEADKTLLLGKDELIARCERLKVALLAVNGESSSK